MPKSNPPKNKPAARRSAAALPVISEPAECANVLKVLADPTRLSVVRQLIDGPRHVGDLNEALGLEQSLLSHHLKVLRRAGIVVSQRDGKAVLYRLAPLVQGNRRGKAIDLGCCLLSFD